MYCITTHTPEGNKIIVYEGHSKRDCNSKLSALRNEYLNEGGHPDNFPYASEDLSDEEYEKCKENTLLATDYIESISFLNIID